MRYAVAALSSTSKGVLRPPTANYCDEAIHLAFTK